MKLDDFSKIYNQNIEVTKVLHKNLLVWSSGFDGDFSKPELWELGYINWSTGQSVADSTSARTKNFYEIPSSTLSVTIETGFGGELFFYAEDNSFIGAQEVYSSDIMSIPNGATYYKITFHKGSGAQWEPMNIPVFVPEANIKVEGI